jgi:hypothetical protein
LVRLSAALVTPVRGRCAVLTQLQLTVSTLKLPARADQTRCSKVLKRESFNSLRITSTPVATTTFEVWMLLFTAEAERAYNHHLVTTVARNLSGPSGDPAIAQSFDQEAAAVLMSRIAVFKAEVDDGPDVLPLSGT